MKATGKPEKRKKSVRTRLVVCLSVFVIAILALVWVLQTVFLYECYELIKRRDMISAAERFSQCIDDEDLSRQLLAYCEQNGIYAQILDESGSNILNADATGRGNDLYGISYYDLVPLIMKANEAGGTAFEKYTSSEIAVPQLDRDNSVFRLDDARIKRFEGLVYVRLVQRADSSTAVIVLNTLITPLDSTMGTLRVQLIFVSMIVLLTAVILGVSISRTISEPIVRVNRAAKNLSRGEYTPPKKEGGYLEIDELNRTLTQAASELSQTENMRRELLANVSHDLRTPLTMITGYAEMMRDIPGENTPQNVQVIIDESKRLSGLVNDLLDVSKYSAGTQKLECARYDLTADIREILSRYTQMQGDGVSITFEAEEDVYVNADQKRIEQVVYNLVNNALQYTRDQTVTVRQSVENRVVRIEVIDRGEGIPEADLPWIWDRYYKVDKTHKRARIGTGLGLSIVKNILQLHAAKFGVRSKLGEGSTFWFELPVVHAPKNK